MHGHGNLGCVGTTLKDALKVAGLSRKQRPRLLSNNGPCYVSSELKGWLADHGMDHTRGKPYHPITQGKIKTKTLRLRKHLYRQQKAA